MMLLRSDACASHKWCFRFAKVKLVSLRETNFAAVPFRLSTNFPTNAQNKKTRQKLPRLIYPIIVLKVLKGAWGAAARV